MGCGNSSHERGANNRLRRPRPWTHDEPISPRDLRLKRDFFWRHAPSCYGGRRVIWEALKDAAECDNLDYKQRILDINNIRLVKPDMTECIDDTTGRRYKLPLHVLSDPTNMI